MYRRQQRGYHATGDIDMDTDSVIPQYLRQQAAPPSTHAPGRRGQASSRRTHNPYTAPSAEMRKAMKIRRRNVEDWKNMSVKQIVQQNPGLSVKEFVAELNIQKRLEEMKKAKAEQAELARRGLLKEVPVVIPVISPDDATEIVEENPEDAALEAEARRRLIEETDGDFEDPPTKQETTAPPTQGPTVNDATATPKPVQPKDHAASKPTPAAPSLPTPVTPLRRDADHGFTNAAPCPSPAAKPPTNEPVTVPVEDPTPSRVQDASPSDSHKGNQLNEPRSGMPQTYPFASTPVQPQPPLYGPTTVPSAPTVPPVAATTGFSSPPQPPYADSTGPSWAPPTIFPEPAPMNTQSFTMSGPSLVVDPNWTNLWNPFLPSAAPPPAPVQPRVIEPTTEEMFAAATAFWNDMACAAAQSPPRPTIVVPAVPTPPVATTTEPQTSERVRDFLRSTTWRPELVAPRPPRIRPALGVYKPKGIGLRKPYRPQGEAPTIRPADPSTRSGSESGDNRSDLSRADLEPRTPKRKFNKDDDPTCQPPEPKRRRGVWAAPTQTWEEWLECLHAPHTPPTPVIPTASEAPRIQRVSPPRKSLTPKRSEPPAPPPAQRPRGLPSPRRRYDPIEVKKRPSYYDTIRDGLAKIRSFVTGS